MILVIDDDEIMANCISRAVKKATLRFANAIEAMNVISDGVIPELIFLDILLDGPDGFTFLNELVSYADTVRIPVVVVTSLNNVLEADLGCYGVVGILDKTKMLPSDIKRYVDEYC